MFTALPDYNPDMATINGKFTDVMVNLLPSATSYIPMRELVEVTPTVPDEVLSAISLRVDDHVKIFVGTKTKLFVFNKGTESWLDLTPDGVEYHATKEHPWSFTQFGELLIAVNYNDKPQSFNLNNGTKFEDLAGDPPQAGIVTTWGDFVCLMKVKGHPRRAHWSGLNKPTHWTVKKESCDFQDFPDGDYIQGSSSATNPIIVMRSCVYKGTFVAGSGLVFSFQKIHDDRGAKSSLSIVSRGDMTFFLSDSGFQQILADGTLISIGSHRVDRTIFAKFDNDTLDNARGCIDPVYNRVYWTIRPPSGKQSVLVYDWGLDKWSTLKTPISILFPTFAAGYSLDDLDIITKNIDQLSISLDSKVWQTGAPLVGALTTSNKIGYFAGKNMEAIVESPEMGRSDGKMAFVRELYAEIDTANALLSVGSRHIRDVSYKIKWSNEHHSSYHTGAFNLRCRSRYLKFRFRVPAGAEWSHFTGYDVELQPAGAR